MIQFKVLLIGPGSVGKTSLFNRFVNNRFSSSYKITMGVDFLEKELEFDKETVKLTIWDVGGQERFKTMRRTYYRGTSGILLIFDLTRPDTFQKVINTWYPELITFCGNDTPFFLIGNKVDLIEDLGSIIEEEKASQFAESKKSVYIKTSAKTGENVEEAFRNLARKIAEKNDFEIE